MRVIANHTSSVVPSVGPVKGISQLCVGEKLSWHGQYKGEIGREKKGKIEKKGEINNSKKKAKKAKQLLTITWKKDYLLS